MSKSILVIGATSAMAKETAKIFAADANKFFLVGRDEPKLNVVKQDLLGRGAAKVEICCQDLNDFGSHGPILTKAVEAIGAIDIALIAHGTLPDQKAAERDYAVAAEAIKINFLSVVSLAGLLGNYFEQQRQGTLAVITSVAGDRGRASNYVYGAAKGGVTRFMEGLGHRLSKSNAHVVIIKPGFVESPMTAHLPKNFLFVKPEEAGRAIYAAIKKNKSVAYVPAFWRWIMLAVIHTPSAVFHKTNL